MMRGFDTPTVAYWNRLPDGSMRLETVPLPAISAAAYAALPERLRNPPAVPRESARWKTANMAELGTRMVGGPWAETWAVQRMKAGEDAAAAITAARAAAPAANPATFPRLVASLQRAGRDAEAAWVQTGRAQTLAPAAIAQAATTAAQEPADTAVALLALLALLL